MSPAHPKPGKRGPSIGQRSRQQVSALRDMLYLRDDYRCCVSGTDAGLTSPCEGPVTVQHRVGKGAGGSALFDGPEYLITMCLSHNVRAESSAEFARTCRANGWSVRRNGLVDVAKVPALYRDGWYLLDTDGCSRQRIHPSIAEKLMEQAA